MGQDEDRLRSFLLVARKFGHAPEMTDKNTMKLTMGSWRPEDALNPCWMFRCTKCNTRHYVCKHANPGTFSARCGDGRGDC